jgi:beta-lactamase regulating signal transducer with metallopeptidase domain
MEEKIILLDPILKSVKHRFQQQQPYSLWLVTGLMVCLTHVLAQTGFRPVCAIVLIALTLHVFNCFESKDKAGNLFYRSEIALVYE